MKQKILILPTYFPTKGAEIVGSMVKEQSELMQEYYDIRIVYCLPGMGLKRFIINLLIGFVYPLYKTCDDKIVSGTLCANGVYYYQSKLFSKQLNNTLKNLAYKHVVKELIKQEWAPKLIHSRTAEHTGLQALYLSRALGIPNLLTENCIFIQDENITKKKMHEYRASIEGATKVAVVSHYLKAFLLSHKFRCDPFIIGNMVNDDIFKIMIKKSNKKNINILTAAHTGYTKDWETFFKTIQYLSLNIKTDDLKVIVAVTQIYGDDSIKHLTKIAEEYNVLNYCTFKIQVPRDEMVILMQESDIFLATSINETFGIATLEAMFCGVPVVSTRNGGIEDFSTHENSILCNIGDYEALANAIIEIYEKKKTFTPETIRNSVIHKYGKEAFKMRLKKLYDETIETSNV